MVAWVPVHKTTLLPTVYVQHATWISYEESPPPHHLPREVEERPSSKIERSGGKLLIDTVLVSCWGITLDPHIILPVLFTPIY